MEGIAEDQLLKILNDIEDSFKSEGKIENYSVQFGVEVLEDPSNLYQEGGVSFDPRTFKPSEKKSALDLLYSYPNLSMKIIPYALLFSVKTNHAEHYIRILPVQGVAYVDFDLLPGFSKYPDEPNEHEKRLIKILQRYVPNVRYGGPESSVEVEQPHGSQEPVSLGTLFG